MDIENVEEKIYTLTLEDGSKIENLHLNGNNFVSETEIDPEIFDGNLGSVTINDGERDMIYKNLALVQITQIRGKHYIFLREISKAEMDQAKLRSDIDYLSMMSNIEI